MGYALIIAILTMTIPRWALTLAQVDKFGVFLGGNWIPVAAIGEAVVLELGNLYILRRFSETQRYDFQYRTEWEALKKRNDAAGHNTHKPDQDPRIGGYRLLPVMLLILEALTLIAQTPFMAGELLNTSAASLLLNVGPTLVWTYAFLLVLAPGIMSVAIGYAINYEKVMSQIRQERGEETQTLRDQVAHCATAWIEAFTRRTVGDQGATTGRQMADQQATIRPVTSAHSHNDRPVSDQWATTDQSVGETEEASEELAGHLVALRDRLAHARQQGNANGSFRRADLQKWLGLSKSHALNVITYGKNVGVLEDANKRYHYKFTSN